MTSVQGPVPTRIGHFSNSRREDRASALARRHSICRWFLLGFALSPPPAQSAFVGLSRCWPWSVPSPTGFYLLIQLALFICWVLPALALFHLKPNWTAVQPAVSSGKFTSLNKGALQLPRATRPLTYGQQKHPAATGSCYSAPQAH